MTVSDRFVIIGGDAAGMSAAMQIRRTLPDAGITVFEMGGTYSYAQCGLPYYIGGQVASADRLIARTQSEFQNKYHIQAFTYHQVTAIHPDSKQVTVLDIHHNRHFKQHYDKLLIATGGSPVLPDWKGRDAEGVVYLKTIPDAEAIRNLAAEESIRNVVVVGAGYIGLEMVEAFHRLGKKVTVIQRGKQIAGVFDAEMAKITEDYLVGQGVALELEHNVEEIVTHEGRAIAVRTDKKEIVADLVLVAIGIVPNSQLAAEAGIELSKKNAILINEKMETNVPGIYAAGDCATQYHRIKKEPDYIPLGTTANKQGRIAGSQMAGGSKTFAGVVGSAVLKVMDMEMARTGLSEKEAKQLGLDVETVTIQTTSYAGYYPDAKELTVKLVYAKGDGMLLGGQAVGFGGVDKRIDVLATALFNEMTVSELEDLDISYAPPFNSSWDPIQQAARIAGRHSNKQEG